MRSLGVDGVSRAGVGQRKEGLAVVVYIDTQVSRGIPDLVIWILAARSAAEVQQIMNARRGIMGWRVTVCGAWTAVIWADGH